VLVLYFILFSTIFSSLPQDDTPDPLLTELQRHHKIEEQRHREQELFAPKSVDRPKVPQPTTTQTDDTRHDTVSEFKGWRPQRRLNSNSQPCTDPARDYKVWPIRVEGWFSGPHVPCDVPCVGGAGGPIGTPKGEFSLGTRYHDVSSSQGSTCTPQFMYTMENVPTHIDHDYHARYEDRSKHIKLSGTTSYETDFPLPYFSWAEYPIMYPYNKAKTATALVAAFVSNCGPQKRLQWMKELQAHGVSVHSYGRCDNNIQVQREKNWLVQKNELTKTYKFTFAFENSDTDDYVTEKLFGPFVAGSVPLYDGAHNAYEYVPSKKSAIYAFDFPSAKELAAYLLYLDKNDTAYQEYLTWKEDGLSQDFIAHSDIARVHSKCRLCIRTADLQRLDVGKQFAGNPWQEENDQAAANKSPGSRLVRIRERGKFWMREIYVNTLTHNELNERIIEKYQDHPKLLPVYSFYNLWDPKRQPITTDEQVQKLFEDAYPEVEIIFTEPSSTDRYSYSEWYYQKNGLPIPPIPPPIL